MTEVRKCEEHPHLSYSADLALHAKTTPSGRSYRSGWTGATKYQATDAKTEGHNQKSIVFRIFAVIGGLLLMGAAIVGIAILRVAETWASELVRVEQADAAVIVFQTRFVGGLAISLGLMVPVCGFFLGYLIYRFLWNRFLSGSNFRKFISLTVLSALFLLGTAAMIDFMGPPRVTLKIDSNDQTFTLTRTYIARPKFEKVVMFEHIQLIKRGVVVGDDGTTVTVRLALKDGSEVKVVSGKTSAVDEVFVALVESTGVQYEENIRDNR